MKLDELKKQLENCSNENERKALEKEIALKEYLKAHNDKYKERLYKCCIFTKCTK